MAQGQNAARREKILKAYPFTRYLSKSATKRFFRRRINKQMRRRAKQEIQAQWRDIEDEHHAILDEIDSYLQVYGYDDWFAINGMPKLFNH